MNLWQRFRQWLRGEQTVYYIGGSDVLPPPLKGEAERQAIEGLGRGEEAARQTLVEHNLRLVVYIARRFENTGTSLEDLISIGTIGLIKAIDTYRQGKGVRLATYASRCIENELLMTFRSDKKQSREVFLYEPLGGDDGEGNSLNFLDVLESEEEDVLERLELEDNISKLYGYIEECLTGREKKIIRLRYGVPEQASQKERPEVTQREIAKKMGISRSYVSRIEKKALQKLRKAYEKGELI